MAASYSLLSSNTLGSTATSVTFTSIPATYSDLLLKVSARGPETFVYIKFNGDGVTTNYASTYLRGSTVISNRSSGADVFPVYGGTNLDTYVANTFSNTEFYIPSYTASQSKAIYGVGSAEDTNNSVNFLSLNAGYYSSTTAISSIELTLGGISSFAAGSSFYLYGIKNS